MATVTLSAPTVVAGVAAARRFLGLKLKDSRVVCDNRSGEGEPLHRITLATGDVVELTCIPHKRRSEVQRIE